MAHGQIRRGRADWGPERPIIQAAWNGLEHVVEVLKNAGASQQNVWDALLWGAVDHANTELMERALTHGADPNTIGEDELPAVIIAARIDNGTPLDILLRSGADPNVSITGGEDETRIALDDALECEDLAAVRLLLAAGANLLERRANQEANTL